MCLSSVIQYINTSPHLIRIWFELKMIFNYFVPQAIVSRLLQILRILFSYSRDSRNFSHKTSR